MSALDQNGIEQLPLEARDSTPLHQFWIWMGANLAPINWIIGSLGIVLGLSLTTTLAVIVLGNVVGCAVFALFCVIGARTGVNQMVLSRAAFGRRGAYLPAAIQGLMCLAWIAVNTWVVLDLCLGVLDEVGITGGEGLRLATAAAIMAVQVLIGIFGFYAISAFEKWTVPLVALVMLVMTVLAIGKVDIVWDGGTASGSARFTAITQLVTAIGVGWGFTWLTWSADYSRFLAPGTSDRRVFGSAFAGLYIPTVWLATLGAVIASGTKGEGEPAAIVAGLFGAMTIPVLLVVAHGPVATNVLNLYSSSLSLLSLDVRARRWIVTTVSGVLASGFLYVLIQQQSFAQSFGNFISSAVMWISAWAGVMLAECVLRRRMRIDVEALYEPPERSPYGDVNGAAVTAFLLGLVAGWAFEYGLVGAFQGPLARATGGVDLSWLAALVVAGGGHLVLARLRDRRIGGAPGVAASEARAS